MNEKHFEAYEKRKKDRVPDVVRKFFGLFFVVEFLTNITGKLADFGEESSRRPNFTETKSAVEITTITERKWVNYGRQCGRVFLKVSGYFPT